MPKYEVTLTESIAHSVRLWAEDTDEAIKLAYEKIMNGPDDGYYSESLGTDHHEPWVEEIEGDD